MSLGLITKDKKFAPLFWTQFFGALNDNFLKNAMVMLITFRSAQLFGFGAQDLVALAGGVFILPFFLFSSLAGQLADKFDKTKFIRAIKAVEIGIMAIAGLGFWTENFGLLMGVLFLMGIHSAFFGPLKYGIIPELVPEDKLVAGNAFVEMGTFLAILIGTIAGGMAASLTSGKIMIAVGLLLLAGSGLLASLMMPKVPRANPNLAIKLNPISEMMETLRDIYPKKAVFNSVLGISWFWYFGAALLSLIPVFAKDVLFSNAQVVTLFLALFTIGIAAGSMVCEKLSFDRVEIGIVPIGSLGMTVLLLDLALGANRWAVSAPQHLLGITEFCAQPGGYRILADLFGVAIFGGLFTVPLYTLIQQRSDRGNLSRTLGANNIVNALFMVASALTVVVFHHFHLTIPQMFLAFALINFAVAIYIYSIVPEFTLRFLAWVLVHIMYRLRVTGFENLPKEGAAVLICNHVSFVDWLIIGGAVKRPVRFVMYYKFARIPLFRYLLKHAQVIPIAGKKEDPIIFETAFQKVSDELKAGELVCIFPEGGLSQTGELDHFKNGVLYIIKRDPVPVIPMALKNLWGSFFSRKSGKAMTSFPRRFWSRVGLAIGAPVPPPQVQIEDLEKRVASLLEATPPVESITSAR